MPTHPAHDDDEKHPPLGAPGQVSTTPARQPAAQAMEPPVGTGAQSVGTGAQSVGTGAQSVGTGAQERRQLTGRAGIVAAGTLGSRILGLLRDQVIAALFVAASTDAFFVAFTIPNVLRQLLAEGAVQNAALPVLERVRERSGDEAAKRAFAALRGLSLVALLMATIVGVVFAEPLVELFATGYRQHAGQFERTVTLTRWLFPYIFFMGTAALSVAALNVHRRFLITAFAPGLLNVALIAAALLLPAWFAANGWDPVLALAVGALVGGLLQVVAQWPSLQRIGYLSAPRLSLTDPAVRETLRRMGPVLIGIGIYYIDVVLARRFLSELEVGSQSYFGWALRLCDFPQGIFVMALQAATLPSLSRLVARGELEEVERTFTFAMRLTLYVGVSASIAAVVLAEPLTILIFQRGHFDATSAHETARALMAQGLGIWMVAAVRQLVSVYYAFGDTKTPVRVAAIDLCVFVALALVLRKPLGHVGVSLAVSGASFVQMVLLWWKLKHKFGTFAFRPVAHGCGKTLVAASLAAVLARVTVELTASSGADAWSLAKPGIASSCVFVAALLGFSWLLRSEELGALGAAWSRSKARPST